MLRKIRTDGARATGCLPEVPRAPWFDMFKQLLQSEPVLVPRTPHTFLKYAKYACGKTPWGHTVIARVGLPNGFKPDPLFSQRLGYAEPKHTAYIMCLNTAREISVAMADAEGQPAFEQATSEEQQRRTRLTQAHHEQEHHGAADTVQ
ncbi:hypothetical protein SARC_09702 [Sphaeroforma arctica JP610]|uniref:Uncharacterized protein n=1 Tax=Sphaeroforma arctica JP610 TaxID=667725 RepID=A0A0L0FM41_9EUKA|nr:hypothetical protein SARC_09702 [Sphaeroforma arctica JP610]KNC77847.1 hypothetical protein SARC_09702 [Sphaeroforma arctica JP610]|eukprot:XP_014151749.1 hypothetical protein SARC_09702 [Sphaeroforma arctica JP610]